MNEFDNSPPGQPHYPAPHAGPVKSRFRLHWVNIALMLLVAILWGLLVYASFDQIKADRPESYRYGYVVGSVLGPWIAGAVFGWLAFLITHRSQAIGNCVFALMLLFTFLVQAKNLAFPNTGMRNDELSTFQSELRETRQEMKRRYDEGITTGTADTIDKLTESMNHLTRGNRDEALIGKVTQKYLQDMKRESAPLEAATQKILAMQLDGETTRETLKEYIGHYQHLQDETKRFLGVYESKPQEIEEQLIKEGVSAPYVKAYMNGLRNPDMMKTHRRWRESVIEVCDVAKDYIAFLETHHGQWSYDTETELVTPNEKMPEDAARQFETKLTNLNEAFELTTTREEAFMKLAAGE